MRADLFVVVPQVLLIPTDAEFPLRSVMIDGYECIDMPPRVTDQLSADHADKAEIDGQPAHFTDAFAFRFRAEAFERRENMPLDPPVEVISQVINSLVDRIRYATKSWHIKPIDFPNVVWQLEYSDDDGNSLPKEQGLIRAITRKEFRFEFAALTPAVWNYVNDLTPAFRTPPWASLLVDATGAMPHIGTSVVLAATALEVFIYETLGRLAEKSDLSPDLWAWISDKKDVTKAATVEEQYDILLKVLCGHSLKEEKALWDGFKHLKNARNKFVHDGVARIEGGPPINSAEALKLLQNAHSVIDKIREWLPDSLRWPVAPYPPMECTFYKLLAKAQPAQPMNLPESGAGQA